MRFQHCFESLHDRNEKYISELLGLRGQEGWELVAADARGLYFKRPIEQEPATFICVKKTAGDTTDGMSLEQLVSEMSFRGCFDNPEQSNSEGI